MASGRLIDYLGAGVLASRPADPGAFTGTLALYWATDVNIVYGWDGAAWDVLATGASIDALEPSGGWSDGAMLQYDAGVSAWVEIPPGVPGQVLTQQSGQVADWDDAAAGGVTSVNGQTGAVELRLEDLTDVLSGTGAPDDGDVLKYSAADDVWRAEPESGGGAVDSVNGQTGVVSLSLEDLDDVLTGTGTPATGDVLTWSGASWTAEPPSGGGVSSVNGQSGAVALSLEDLDDVLVNTGAPDTGDVLTWSGAGWVATPPSGGSSQFIGVFTPMTSQPPTSNFGTLDTRNAVALLDHDATTSEGNFWIWIVPDGVLTTGGLSVDIYVACTSATSGNLGYGVQIAKLTGVDLDTFTYDTATVGTLAVSGTSGVPIKITVAIAAADIDGIQAGDLFALRIYRDTSVGGNATGDAEFVAAKAIGVA
jgi:hypothetical protein